MTVLWLRWPTKRRVALVLQELAEDQQWEGLSGGECGGTETAVPGSWGRQGLRDLNLVLSWRNRRFFSYRQGREKALHGGERKH